MVWGIDSKKFNNPHSQKLRWRLFLSYLTVMMTILGISAIAVYKYTSKSLYDQLDQRLEILAQAASHSLLEFKDFYPKSGQNGLTEKSTFSQTKRYLDYDHDLDIPWQSLRQQDQGIEWFDAQKQLIGNAGTLLNDLPVQPGWQSSQQNRVRTVTLPAYSYIKGKKHLEGYIRSSQVTQEVEAILNRLRWGLGIGGMGVLALTGLGGIWLTRQSLQPIEQSFQQLKQFTADAAHELRSPLAAVKTSVQVMQYYPERFDPRDLNKISAIAVTVDEMTRLVEDLLLLARMDIIDVTDNSQWVNLSLTEILQNLLELFQCQAEEKEITLESNLLTEVEIKGDKTQITRIFRNLLENALQYTPKEGKVTLTMKCERDSVVIMVEDTGIGIAPEDLPLIFDRFWRADKARVRREGGMGMGLAIAKALIKNYNGKISVTSKLSVGSCFRVRLPFH